VITKVVVNVESVSVELADGRVLSAPIGWFPRLSHGTPDQRNHWRLIGGGRGIHRPDLDEDVSVENLLAGKASGESQASLKKWLDQRSAGRSDGLGGGAEVMESKHSSPETNQPCLVESVRVLVHLLLNTKGIHKKHQKRFLDRCLWQLTEAEGAHKYDLRYVSEGARSQVEVNERKGLRHEHVYRRANMVRRLIDNPERADAILNEARGCVVTIEEHKKLDQVDRVSRDVDGWERYRPADIAVFDRRLNRIVSFEELDSAADEP
jgi:hypothetical protein